MKARPNEVECWAIMITMIPMITPEDELFGTLRWIQKMDGFLGVKSNIPYGTICVFRTHEQAKNALIKIHRKGVEVYDVIQQVFIDKDDMEEE